ncbi:MAG: helix-turn-helix domain-containing protein [Planctomycetota bacterium]
MAGISFSTALKAARLEAGLSQAALGRRAGLTGSYISFLESGRRRPPTPRVIRALCQALAIPEGPLQEAAALERSPPQVRRRLERMRRERKRARRLRDRLLTTTLFHLTQGPRALDPLGHFLGLPADQQAVLDRVLARLRGVHSTREADSRAEVLLEGVPGRDREALVRILPQAIVPGNGPGPPPEKEAIEDLKEEVAVDEAPSPVFREVPVFEDLGRGRRPIDRVIADPRQASRDALFWRAHGDDGHPRVEAGDLLLLEPRAKPRDGDLVVLRHEGRIRFGTYRHQGEAVQITFPRPEVPPLRIPPRVSPSSESCA